MGKTKHTYHHAFRAPQDGEVPALREISVRSWEDGGRRSDLAQVVLPLQELRHETLTQQLWPGCWNSLLQETFPGVCHLQKLSGCFLNNQIELSTHHDVIIWRHKKLTLGEVSHSEKWKKEEFYYLCRQIFIMNLSTCCSKNAIARNVVLDQNFLFHYI